MKRTILQPLQWVLAALVFAGLACNLPGFAAPSEPPPVSAPSRSAEDEFGAAATQMAENGRVTLVLDEAQLTDMIAKDLQQQSDPMFANPQVAFRNGQILFSGTVNQEGISVPMQSVLAVSATAEGGIQYQVVEARLGPFPLPESMLNDLTAQLDQGLTANLNDFTREVFIEDITIGEREMIITGRKRS